MSIKVVQTCDRCGVERIISASTENDMKEGGWRKLPVRFKFGEARNEQPWLDPNCLREVEAFIDRGVGPE